MNATERHAIKLLIDSATRAKIQAEGGQSVRRYGRTQRFESVKTVFFPTMGHGTVEG